jgi:hypothetical protein
MIAHCAFRAPGPPRERTKTEAAVSCVARTATRRGANRSLEVTPPPKPHRSHPSDTEKSSPKCKDFLRVIPSNERAGWTGRNVSQVFEIASHACVIRWGGIRLPGGARNASRGSSRCGSARHARSDVGLKLGRDCGLQRLVQLPRRLEPGEVEAGRVYPPKRRLGRCSHQRDDALRQATGTHPVVRGLDAPNPAEPDTELAVAPGAHVHRTAFPW